MRPICLVPLTVLAAALSSPAARVQQAPYRDPKVPVAERVADLLARMTLEEKVAQLKSLWAGRPRIDDAVLADGERMAAQFGHGLGMLNPDFDASMEQTIERRNRIQDYTVTKTRLGIPILFLDEALHGLVGPAADSFPMPIALAASWDLAQIKGVYTHAAAQANSRGTHLVLSPVVDVTRDPRWGRTGETFGEDPYLNGVVGSTVVEGLQGSRDGSIAENHVAATLKHLTGHGEPEAGINQGPGDVPVRSLRAFHLEPFRLCIARSKPAAVMPAYCEVDGIPAHVNRWLLNDVLRGEWGFDGVVVSDWFAIEQLVSWHCVAADAAAVAPGMPRLRHR